MKSRSRLNARRTLESTEKDLMTAKRGGTLNRRVAQPR